MKYLAALLLCFLASCGQRVPDKLLTDKDGDGYLLTDCLYYEDSHVTNCRVNKLPK